MMLAIFLSLPVIILGGVIFYHLSGYPFNLTSFSVGAVLGTAANVLKVVLLDRSVKKAITLEAAKATNYVNLQALLRFVVTGSALLACVLIPPIKPYAIYGAALTLVAYQVSAYSTKLFVKKGS